MSSSTIGLSHEYGELPFHLDEFIDDFSHSYVSAPHKNATSVLQSAYSSSSSLELIDLVKNKKVIVKKAHRKTIGKRGRELNDSQQNGHKVQAKLKLLVFPHFDKCDSLIYFPHSMVRMLNSGDLKSLSKMMHSYVHPSCKVNFAEDKNFTTTYHQVLEVFAFEETVHPDSLMCVHNTKVESNEIKATVYFKFTDCKQLSSQVPLPDFKIPFEDEESIATRSGLKKKLIKSTTAQVDDEVLRLIDSERDIVVYGKMQMNLKVDDFSKKIMDFMFQVELTSCAPAVNIYDTLS